MKKRMLALLLAAVLLLTLLPRTAVPEASAASNSCGTKLTWSYKSGTLTISGSGTRMNDYAYPGSQTAGGAPWAEYASKIKTVKLPATLQYVGECAFADCTALKEIVLPDSVTRIGACAFEGCTALQKISFSKKLQNIQPGAFRYCSALKEVILPAATTHVGYGAFTGCSALRVLACLNADLDVGVAICSDNETEEDLQLVQLAQTRSTSGQIPFQADTKEDLVFVDNEAAETLGSAANTMLFGKPHSGKVFQLPADRGLIEKVAYLESYAASYKYKFYPVNKFVDVKDGDACQIPVAWAVGNKVTAGMDKTHFAPTQTVTRAQAMTFFWAAQNKPKFKRATTRFVDVKKTDWFYKSVMWAVEQGVTAGTDATHFSPNKTCNRGEILAFLYASLKKPKVSIKNPYSDVGSQWYKKAALWAFSKGIEKGENGKFNASTPCTRASTVTYLYRFFTGCGLME